MSTLSTVSLSDEEVIKSFPRYEGPGVSGYFIDFLGIRTKTSYIRELPQQGAVVEGYPLPSNFHATAIEWAGVLRAVLEGDTDLVAVELGAGWAPWLVTVARAAQLKGVERVHLVGVEGYQGNCELIVSHFRCNGLNPELYTLLHGVVGTTDGVAEFPCQPGYGSRAIFPVGTMDRAGSWRLGRRAFRAIRALRSLLNGLNGRQTNGDNHPATVQVKRFSVSTLLRPFPKVDLVHVDIQGDEYELILSAREVLKEKVKRLVIGTHSRTIEQSLLEELARQSWVLESEETCMFEQRGLSMILMRDGCQVWRNPGIPKTRKPG
jgi:FkbM family methyltransferase